MHGNQRAATPSNTDRAISDLVREGVVESVNLDAGTAIVRIGDILTPPCSWSMSVGDTSIWIPLTVGQPVLVSCPEGDIERAFISGSLPTTAMPALALGDKVGIRFKDGALITYDPAAQLLQIELPGQATVVAPGGLSIEANVAVQGDLSVSGTVTGATDVIGAGKSLKSHKHPGVTAGSAVSGAPQ